MCVEILRTKNVTFTHVLNESGEILLYIFMNTYVPGVIQFTVGCQFEAEYSVTLAFLLEALDITLKFYSIVYEAF